MLKFSLLHLESMRIMMFRGSGFYCTQASVSAQIICEQLRFKDKPGMAALNKARVIPDKNCWGCKSNSHNNDSNNNAAPPIGRHVP